MIVSDAGPIIIFARIRRLSLLQQVTGSLTIPDAVYDEIVVKKGGMPGAAEVASAGGFNARLSQTVRLRIGCRPACTLASARRSRWPRSGEHSC